MKGRKLCIMVRLEINSESIMMTLMKTHKPQHVDLTIKLFYALHMLLEF